jgi:hypothetical protein
MEVEVLFITMMRKEIMLIRIDKRKRLIGLYGLLYGLGAMLGKYQ